MCENCEIVVENIVMETRVLEPVSATGKLI